MSHAITANLTLGTAVAQAGTFTIDYPEDYSVDDFTLDAPQHVLAAGASAGSKKYYTSSDDFSVAFGASSITVTWKNATTLAVGTVVSLQLDLAGANNDPTEELVLPERVRRTNVAYLDLGKPDTADDDYFFASATFPADAPALLQTTLDVPRNITVTSDGADSGKTFTVTGADEYGNAMVEVITGPASTVVGGKKAFKTVSSIEISAESTGNIKVGFGDVLGLPVWVPAAAHVLEEYQDGAGAVSGTFLGGLARATASTGTTADVRGTYDPNDACNAAKHFKLLVALDDPTYKGNQQYDG